MNFVDKIVSARMAKRKIVKKAENFGTGDTVKVHVRIKEGEKERVQIFKGVVIKVQGAGLSRSFTVRKISSGVGVERTFPLASPKVEKIELTNRGMVRRARLYYLRKLSGRAARLNSTLVLSEGDTTSVDTIAAELEAKEAAKRQAEEGPEQKAGGETKDAPAPKPEGSAKAPDSEPKTDKKD